jgi:hypothetical protein
MQKPRLILSTCGFCNGAVITHITITTSTKNNEEER